LILLGTLAPLFADLFLDRKLSVGAEYFGLVFPVFSVPLLLLVVFGPLSRWGREEAQVLLVAVRIPLAIAIVVGLGAALALGGTPLKAVLGVVLAGWVAAGTLLWLKRRRERGVKLTGESFGMLLAHLGLAIWATGAVLVESLNVQTDVRMARDGVHELAGYQFKLSGLEHYEGPNYIADKGTMEIRRDGELIAVLHPEKRQYRAGGQVMTEAGIQPGVFRDLFVSLGEPMDDGAAWAVRLQYKPFIRWVWAGAALMMLGGFAAALDRRFRARRTAEVPTPTPAPAAPAATANAPEPEAA
jgi:cytochrome c-type biogenesis protein CcmF